MSTDSHKNIPALWVGCFLEKNDITVANSGPQLSFKRDTIYFSPMVVKEPRIPVAKLCRGEHGDKYCLLDEHRGYDMWPKDKKALSRFIDSIVNTLRHAKIEINHLKSEDWNK